MGIKQVKFIDYRLRKVHMVVYSLSHSLLWERVLLIAATCKRFRDFYR